MLELRTGKRYEELIKETICEPLGLGDTTITLSPEQTQRLALEHSPDGAVVANWKFGVPESSPKDSPQDSPEDYIIYWHNGGIGGYVSFVGFDKTHHTDVVILSNSGGLFANDYAVDEMRFTILQGAAKVSIVSTAWERPHSWHDIE